MPDTELCFSKLPNSFKFSSKWRNFAKSGPTVGIDYDQIICRVRFIVKRIKTLLMCPSVGQRDVVGEKQCDQMAILFVQYLANLQY